MNESTEVVLAKQNYEVVRAEDFLPVFSVEQAVDKKHQMNAFINQVLNEDSDYGKMPGGRETKILFKPGAEKLCSIFGLTPQYVEDKIIEDWTGAEHGGEPLFYYSYRCQLSRGGRFMGEAIGSCNSWESKYRYRWVSELQPGQEATATRGGRVSEPVFAIDRAETGGKYGKPAEYWQRFKDAITAGTAAKIKKPKKDGGTMEAWEIDATMYRIPNPEVPDTINTCQKMAQKRALVAAVLVVTNCSDAFTQDLLEDFDGGSASEPPLDGAWDEGKKAQAEIVERKTTPAKAPPAVASQLFEALKAFAAMKEGLGSQIYYFVLSTNGFHKSNEITDEATAKRVYKQMVGVKKLVDAAANGEVLEGMNASLFAVLPDTSIAAIQREMRKKLAGAFGTEVGQSEFDEMRAASTTNWEFLGKVRDALEEYEAKLAQ